MYMTLEFLHFPGDLTIYLYVAAFFIKIMIFLLKAYFLSDIILTTPYFFWLIHM